MNRKHLRITLYSLLFTLYWLFSSSVASAAQAQTDNSGKVGYADVARIFDEYQKTKDQDKVLETKQNGKQAERDKMVEDIRKLRDEMELLSDKAKQAKQDMLDEKIKKLQDFDRAVTSDLKIERDKMARDILREIDEAIQDFGKKGNYSAIINQRVLLYYDENADVTERIITTLNEKYGKGR